MPSRLNAALLVALVVAPAPILAQNTVLGDTVWVEQSQLGVGRAISVEFADAADRSVKLREEVVLPTVEGKSWRVEDIVVAVDIGTRSAVVTWRVVGPAVVVDAFESARRRQAETGPTTRSLVVRPLVVRCACTQ